VKSSGPFAATTDAALPVGSHDVEIADFPHSGGVGYGNLGTVWFRLGHNGDRSMMAGVLTFKPSKPTAVAMKKVGAPVHR